MAVTPEGEVLWQARKRVSFRGSHESSVTVVPSVDAHFSPCLVIDGNPTKFLQGHNLWGSDDLVGLASALVEALAPHLAAQGVPLTPQQIANVQAGIFEILRVDVTYMYATGSLDNALAFVHALGEAGSMAHRGRACMEGETAILGKGSRRFSLMAYAKGHELAQRGHRLPEPLRNIGLEEYAADKVRFEARYRAMHLRDHAAGLRWGANWTLDTPPGIFGDTLARVNFPGDYRMTAEELQGIPGPVRMTYLAWKSGEDVKRLLTKRTFYRHRAALLPHGIDIAARKPNPLANVVPLRRVIEAVPAAVPEWAKGTPLYFEPRRRA